MTKITWIFCVFLTIFGACQQAPSRQQSLKINIISDPPTLDPRKARDLNAITVMNMLFEGLSRISKSGSTELALAEKVEISNDCSRFVFYLRKSLWSNGDPVTSHDFVSSWKSSLSPEFATDQAYQLYVIKGAKAAKSGEIPVDEIGVHAPNSRILIVELEQPTPYFLELLKIPVFFPVHKSVFENADWSIKPETHIGNGPFILENWKRSAHLTVQKNPNYWESDRVLLEQIELAMMTPDTELRMFEDGKIDWAGSPLSNIPIDAVAHLKNTKEFHSSNLSGTYFLRLNTAPYIGEKKNPLSNANIRRALSMAVDRTAIAEHILQGGQQPAFKLVPNEMELSTKLKSLEDMSGRELYKLGLTELALDLYEPLMLSFSGTERNASITQALQKQWEDKLGITVLLEAVEPKAYFQKISQKDFQMAAGSWIADFNDPINFLEVFKYKKGSTNNTDWEDTKYIDLLNRSAICKESEERKQLLSEAETILLDQMPIIPIFYFALNYLQQDRLEDVALSPLGQIDFRWAHKEANPSQKR
ncbi:MAG: peptide ABC transporter substrate-binding protein [Verrucomicrobia bacterium]|nr:peptide ABC transporter substrate-binding protein [Verrucomicrobiota bacterium]